MEKHIIIDEKKIFDTIYANLEDSYTLTYVNYDDEISPFVLDEILKNGLQDQLSEVYDEQRRYYAAQVLEQLLSSHAELDRNQLHLFKESSEYEELLLAIEERDNGEAEKEIFTRSRIRCRVMLHSNYDCWLPLWETGGLYGKDDALEGIMKMLCLNPAKVKQEALKQGVACYRTFPNLKYRNGKEVVSYEGFVKCLIECPNYGLWTFFGYFDMKALWNTGLYDSDNEERFDNLVIPSGTTCAMFNDWNGGGSCEFTKTIRPVSISELRCSGSSQYDCPRIYIDEKFKEARGFSSGEVYGDVISKEEILC